jgi:tetratricopeptide (TPR) repeat protein
VITFQEGAEMRIFVAVMCVAMLVLLQTAKADEQELMENARLGSVTYNISIRFWQDEIFELTPDERNNRMNALSSRYEQGGLTPLETYELICLFSLEERSEDEEKTISTLSSRIDSILEKNPKDHEALITLVRLSSREGNNDILFSLLADTTLQDITYRALLIELSNLHFGLGNYEKAEKAIDYLLAVDSLDTEALMTKASIRATALILSLFTQGFVTLTEEMEQVTPEDRLPLTATRINEEYKEIDFSLVQKAMQQDPDGFEFHCFVGGVKGFILYLHYLVLLSVVEEEDSFPRFTEESIPVLKDIEVSLVNALKAKPAGDIDAYMALAIHSLVMTDYVSARSYAQKAVQTRPDLDQSYDALITVINFQRQAIEDDIEAAFEESIEVLHKKEQHKPLQLIDRLMLLHPAINEGKYAEAIEQLGSIEEEYPNEFSVILFKGGVLLRMGKLDESIEVLSNAKLLDPQSEDVLYNLGLAHSLKDAFGEAKEFLEAAHEIDPSDEEIKSLLEEVNEELK